MRLRMEVSELAAGLNLVRAAIGARTPAIFSGVRIASSEDRVELRASNGDLSLRTVAPAKVDIEGVLIVSHDLISGFVQRAEAQTISMQATNEGMQLVAGAAKAQLPVFRPEDWPRFTEPTGPSSTWSDEVMSAVVGVLHAAAKPGSGQPNLTGVAIDGSSAVATDARRLAVAELPNPVNERALVPADAIRLVANVGGKACDVRVGEATVELRKGDTTCVARLLSGKWPDWRSAMPSQLPRYLTVDRQEFQSALDMALFFADRETAEIQLNPLQDAISIAVTGIAAVEDRVNAETNLDRPVAINGRFLADAFGPLTGESVQLNFTADLGKFVIREGGLTQLVMTIKKI